MKGPCRVTRNGEQAWILRILGVFLRRRKHFNSQFRGAKVFKASIRQRDSPKHLRRDFFPVPAIFWAIFGAFVVMLPALMALTSITSQNSAPPPRRLVVNADDFGRSQSINQAVVRAHREGILTSASLMVNEPFADEAVALARANPGLGVGLHLTLVCGASALAPGTDSRSGQRPRPILPPCRYRRLALFCLGQMPRPVGPGNRHPI